MRVPHLVSLVKFSLRLSCPPGHFNTPLAYRIAWHHEQPTPKERLKRDLMNSNLKHSNQKGILKLWKKI